MANPLLATSHLRCAKTGNQAGHRIQRLLLLFHLQQHGCRKHEFFPFFGLQKISVLAVSGTQVGSNGDNGSGGGYAYRASKAALNIGERAFGLMSAAKP